MRQIITLLFLMTSISTFGQGFEFDYNKDFKKILKQTKKSSSDINYVKLLSRFQNNDTTLSDFEVLSLLIGFTDNEYFKPYRYLKDERKIYSLNGKKKYKEALAMCDSFLVFVPLSQKALIEKSYAFHKLEQPDSAQYYMWQFRRIMNAMEASGDGLTPETAIFSLGPTDGQNYIKKHLASRIGVMGSGTDKYGNFVDILEAKSKDEDEGKKQNMYFHIEHATATMFSD